MQQSALCERGPMSIKMKFAWIVVSWLCVVVLTSCSGTPTPDWQAALQQCPTDAEIGRFEPWDRLEIRVYGEQDLTGEYEVSPLGNINFPLLGNIAIAGLRCDEIETLLTAQLGQQYLKNPSVVCVNKEVKRTAVTVDGQVTTPGSIEFRPGLMLTDAIAQSAGLTVRAQKTLVITRKIGDGKTEAVVVPYHLIVTGAEGASNVCLHPGDFIYVPEAPF